MPIIWLRVALAFYTIGLLYSLLVLTRRSYALAKVALPAMTLGMVFQIVALTEAMIHAGPGLASLHNSETLLALLVMAAFLLVYAIYNTTSPGIVVFPLVFLLTFISASGQQPFVLSSPVRTGWLYVHIALIFAGYAALSLSFGASLIYLLQERYLKSKKPGGLFARLPALETIDEISYRSLLLGFPFMTLGLLAGVVVAESTFGQLDYLDPKILLSVLMWAVYLIMLYTRWNAGWRGRRAAYLATGAFFAAVIAWAANYFSAIHRFVQS